MNKMRSGVIFFSCVAFSLALAAEDPPGRRAHLGEVEQEAGSNTKVDPTSVPVRAPSQGYLQGYQIVTDVFDGFGGVMESDNYGILVHSGGQPSALGICQSENYVIKAGFVHASYVMHGDANADGTIGPGDIVYLLNYLYRLGDEPCPMEAGDANCDDEVGPGDIVFLINYLYRGGPPPCC